MTKTTGRGTLILLHAGVDAAPHRLASKNKEDRDARSQVLLKDKDIVKLNKRATDLEAENAHLNSEVSTLTEELMALGHENETLQVIRHKGSRKICSPFVRKKSIPPETHIPICKSASMSWRRRRKSWSRNSTSWSPGA